LSTTLQVKSWRGASVREQNDNSSEVVKSKETTEGFQFFLMQNLSKFYQSFYSTHICNEMRIQLISKEDNDKIVGFEFKED